jgi:ParB/RepB/Spo0J family partition protein
MSTTLQVPSEAAVVALPLERIRPGSVIQNDRKRFDAAELKELADSIEVNGLAQPITVRPVGEDLEVVAGERRYRAHLLLQADGKLPSGTIPAIVRELTDEVASDIMLIENGQRADLDPIEEAHAYRDRMDRFGYTVAEVARRAGVGAGRVRDRLELLNLREDVQHMVSRGQLRVGHAQLMATLDPNRQGLAARELTASGRTPTVEQFRSICGQLLEQQQQESLFDADKFLVVQIAGATAADEVVRIDVPIDPALPRPRNAISVSDFMRNYLADLQSSPDPHAQAAAATVGTVLAGLMASNLAGSRLRPAI